MKTEKFLFEKITSFENLRLAYTKARKRKTFAKNVISFSEDVNTNLEILRNRLLSCQPHFGNYRQFLITDPKPRVISAAPFEERVMHHAMMNVLEPVFERQMIYHTYACRKGKGTHRAINYALQSCRKFSYYLKLDVRKYFDTIDHAVLKNALRRIIADKKCLALLDDVIDSYQIFSAVSAPEQLSAKGVPIGNLTSQFFANLYLSPLDHFILEKLKPRGYCRYMDDMVIWAEAKHDLQKITAAIRTFCKQELHLTLKEPAIGGTKEGVAFLGCLVSSKCTSYLRHTLKRKRAKLRVIKMLCERGAIDEEKAATRMNAICIPCKNPHLC